MEKTATLNLRVNPIAKQRAENVLKQLGIPMSTAIYILQPDCSCRWDSFSHNASKGTAFR